MRLLLTFEFRLNHKQMLINCEILLIHSGEIQMLKAISLVIKQRKKKYYRIEKNLVFPNLFLCLVRMISLSGHLSRSIFRRWVDIASTQNLLISFKPIICKLNYSRVIISINLTNGQCIYLLVLKNNKHNYHILVDNIVKILPCDKTLSFV
jgi:hypothetical protein